MDEPDNQNPPEQPQPPRILVMKFGGTSVGTAGAMSQAAEIVRQACEAWERVVVVTSAMAGVTDLLLNSAARAVKGEDQIIKEAARQLREKHFTVAETLLEDPFQQNLLKDEIDQLVTVFENLCQAMAVLGESTPRALDAVSSLGERMSVRLLAEALKAIQVPARHVEATQLIVTDSKFQAAHPDMAATERRTREVLGPLLERGEVPVVTGFMAANPQGVITTLGRGGSDYSAAILGAILPADEVWICTDVDGVMSADPRIVPQARSIPTLSFKEIAELAYYGAKVVHPKTIRPVIEASIELRVCNTFNPNHPGTRLLVENPPENIVSAPFNSNHIIKAVTAIRGQRLVTIEGRGMLGVPGVAARAFSAVAATGTSVPLISQASSEQSICFAVPQEATSQVIDFLEHTFAGELERRDIDQIWATGEVVIVTVVGSGMRNTPGVAGQIFNALGSHGVNVIAIAQGSSEVSISLVVDAADTEKAVTSIHDLIMEP
jgi:aspartokinase/homoserine dehydrogenase 1